MKKLITFAILLLSFSTLANDWIDIKIPNAKCGDGKDYKIFYAYGDKRKVSMELMGGGACWDDSTCWGPNYRTWIHNIPKIPNFSYLTTNEAPNARYTKIYFPYCTGDVWAGTHTAAYSRKRSTLHHGSINFALSLNYLVKNKLIDFATLDSLLLYGSSAGAIGAIIHLDTLNEHLSANTKKLLIADSPGLHWGSDFWDKFTTPQINDFEYVLRNIGMHIDLTSGLLSREIDIYCNKYPSWTMSFIQATDDLIMSKLFGNIDIRDHRRNVLGPNGLKQKVKNTSNCDSQIINGKGHAFLLTKKSAEEGIDMDTHATIKEQVDRLIKTLL